MGATQSIERCDGCNFIIGERELVASGHSNPDLASNMLGVPPHRVAPGTCLKKIFGTVPRVHHISCSKVTFTNLASSHPASWRSFEPGAYEDDRRRQWALSQFLAGTRRLMGFPLPIESMPHAPLFREIVAYWNRGLWGESRTFNTFINLGGSVWVMYIEFEGERYVKGFTNEPVGDEPPVYRPGTKNIDAIYFAENYMGVVAVVFGNSKVAPEVPYQRDIYWKSLNFPEEGGRFEALSDGIKIRNLVTVFADKAIHTVPNVSSAIPQPPALPLRRFPPHEWGDNPRHVKVFKFNEPDTSGYSFCWNNRHVAIHAHKLREQNVTFFDPHPSHGPCPVWQYLPIERGEYISMIWHHFHEDRRNAYLSLRTSKGHVIRLGPHFNMCGKPLDDIVVYRPKEDRTTCVYYRDKPANINCMAFSGIKQYEHIAKSEETALPTPPFEPMDCPADFFFSSLLLKEIIDITPCVKTVSGVRIIVGMIVSYLDGHQEAVGQVNRSSMGNPIDATDGSDIWFRFVRIDGHYPNVAEIRLGWPRRPRRRRGEPPAKRARTREENNEDRCWLRLSIFSPLQWWFSDNSTILCAGGKRSPLLRIRDPFRRASLEVLNLGAGPSSRIPGFEYEEDFGDLEDPWAGYH